MLPSYGYVGYGTQWCRKWTNVKMSIAERRPNVWS